MMTDSKKKSEQEKMVQAGLITADDTLVDGVRVTLFEGPMGILATQGYWAYFTNEKLVLFMGAALGWGSFSKRGKVIPYNKIKEIRKSPYMLIMEGVAIDYENPETGALETEKVYFGPGGRKWMSFMSEKAGISQA